MTATNSTTVPAPAIRAMNALATLNSLRAAAGKPPLKAWKASKKELDVAITKAQAAAPITAATPDVPAAKIIQKIDEAKKVTLDPALNIVKLSAEERKQAWKDQPPRRSTIELKSVAISKALTPEQEKIMAANKTQGKKKAAKSGERARYDWEDAEARAAKGTLPTPPDMSAKTHKHYLPKLNEIATLARTGKLKELQAYKVSDRDDGSPGLVKRYQKLAIVALKAKG